MEFSNYLANELLDHTVNSSSLTSPTTVYLGLLTALSDDGDTLTEVTGGSYARQSVAWDAPLDGLTANTATVTFPTPTADWGTVTHAAIFDAASSGNALLYDTFAFPVTIFSGQLVRVSAGDMTTEIKSFALHGGAKTFRNNLVNHVLRNTSLTASDGYAALLTALSDGGDTVTEVTGGAYARVALSFPLAVDGALANDTPVSFPEATAGYSGNVTYVGVYDASTSGNLMYWRKIDSQTVEEGQTFKIPTGELTVTLD